MGQALEMSVYWHLLPGRTIVKQDEMEEGAFLVASLGLGPVLFHLYRKSSLSSFRLLDILGSSFSSPGKRNLLEKPTRFMCVLLYSLRHVVTCTLETRGHLGEGSISW